jgi:hypothetical protein
MQPKRWMVFYAAFFATGIPTVWYFGFGATFTWRTADAVINCILAWALQNAILGDFLSRKRWFRLSTALGLMNLLAIALLMLDAHLAVKSWSFRFGTFGAFSIAELILIGDSFISLVLLLLGLGKIPPVARPMLCPAVCMLVASFFIATTAHVHVNTSLLLFHAMWHIIGSFGFLSFWVFNDIRLYRPEDDY